MKKNPDDPVLKTVRTAAVLGVVLFAAGVGLSHRIIDGIVLLLGAVIALAGFLAMIRVVGRVLQTGQGKKLFLFVSLGKMVVITVGFYLAARISETAVLFYVLGISLIVFSMMADGFRRIWKAIFHGT